MDYFINLVYKIIIKEYLIKFIIQNKIIINNQFI